MPCGAILFFDNETEAAIRGLWQVIEDAGQMCMMPGLNYPPHLTLVVCEDMQFEEVRAQAIPFIAEHPPMPALFNGLGLFNSIEPVLYLAVTADRPLLNFHARFEALVRPYLVGEKEFSRPGAWVPHVTLNQGYPPGTTGAVIEALQRATLPRRGLLKDLVLVDFTAEHAELTEMFRARLGQYL